MRVQEMMEYSRGRHLPGPSRRRIRASMRGSGAVVVTQIYAFVFLVLMTPAAAQGGPFADAYSDDGARDLVRLARERREVIDTGITRYETTAHERMSARIGVARIDRMLFRRETVSRIDWSRDTVRIEVLGAREVQPVVSGQLQLPPPDLPSSLGLLAFDPVGSEMLLRLDSTTLRHPLSPGSEEYYRFSSGDTTTIRLGDGRAVRLVELQVIARRPDPQYINGSLWLEDETHAVVRMAFRLSRRISSSGSGVRALVPETSAEIEHVAIEYGLWDLQWWMPRSMVARGVAGVAGVRVPLEYQRTYEDYIVEGRIAPPAVVVAGDLSSDSVAVLCRPLTYGSITVGAPMNPEAYDSLWNASFDRMAEQLAMGETLARARADSIRGAAGDTASVAASDPASADVEGARPPMPPCDRPFIVTRDPEVDLRTSEVFTSSIYDAASGPLSAPDIERLEALLNRIPDNPFRFSPPSVQLLTPELIRFNRVEGLSLGARVTQPIGQIELGAELRVGTTGELGGRLSVGYITPDHRTVLNGYRGLEAMAVAANPFSLQSTVSALLLGRDENDYFRGAGTELRVSPAAARGQSWDMRLFAERQSPVRARSNQSLRGVLDDDFRVRENVAAERLDQAGATLNLSGARGDDPRVIRTHAAWSVHGETGDRTFARSLLQLGADRIFGNAFSAGIGATVGSGFGDVPVQRLWQIGGAGSVRGHDPAALRGESLWLARAEVNYGPPLIRLSLFGDAGWAGERSEFGTGQPIRGAGVGLTLLDNLLRIDVARGIGGGGTRAYIRLGGSL